MQIDYNKVKLVIWDLDETFWNGVLSEGDVAIPEGNRVLIRDLVDSGVMCSICSKNDEAAVDEKLENLGMKELFVFRSVNWSPKGERIRQIITEMQLRPENVLFIDDNELNLREAAAACPGVMTANVGVLPEMQVHYAACEKKDPHHRRLEQYHLLEKKQKFKATSASNECFLFQCHIQVEIKHDCENQFSRIAELIARTNQLNFTKNRIPEKELTALLKAKDIESGYVIVHDDFGDYGVVGFYALKNDTLLHFLFSCRTLNMGIEQYVYHILGCPKITIVPEVSSSLDLPSPSWINQSSYSDASNKKKKEKLDGKILIKGPCDMEQMFSFIEPTPNIITEFTYVNAKGVSIEQQNHTTQILNILKLSDAEKQRMTSLPFCDAKMYDSVIFDPDISIVMLSLFNDPHLGVYREKATGNLMAFGEYLVDLTDEAQWDAIIHRRVFTARHSFTVDELQEFKMDFEYQGRLAPEEVLENLKRIFARLNQDAVLILCLGSEMSIESDAYLGHESYLDRHEYHQKLNRLVKSWANENDRVLYIDVNDYVKSRDDFLDTINHMKKPIYYQMSQKFIQIVNSHSSHQIAEVVEKAQKVSVLEHIKRRMHYILTGEK